MKRLIRFIQDEKGVTAIEYALIASLIAIVILAAVIFLGRETSQTYDEVANNVAAAS